MKADKSVVEKIAKMLRLANCKGAMQGEVENAMAKAKAMAIRHAIDISSVNIDEQGENGLTVGIEKDSTLRTRSVHEQIYHKSIYYVISEVFGVEIVRTGHRSSGGWRITAIHLIGDPTDIEIAKVIFPWLEKVFPRTLSKLVREGILTYNSADTNGCYWGLARGIIEANAKAEEEMAKELDEKDRNAYALVVVNKEEAIAKRVAVDFPKLKKSKARWQNFSTFAAALGHQEGRNINLKQVG